MSKKNELREKLAFILLPVQQEYDGERPMRPGDIPTILDRLELLVRKEVQSVIDDALSKPSLPEGRE